MNKFYLAFIFFIVSLHTHINAQNHKYELFIGANKSFRSLLYTSNVQPPMVEGDSRVESFNFGLRYRIFDTPNYGFKTGLGLTSYGFMDKKRTGIRWPSETTPQGYIYNPNLPHEIQNGRKWVYLELPLVGEIKKSFGKWTPNMQLELVPQYLVALKTIYNTDLGNSAEIENPPKQYIKLNLALGANIGCYYAL